jgi:hypothetical protein
MHLIIGASPHDSARDPIGLCPSKRLDEARAYAGGQPLIISVKNPRAFDQCYHACFVFVGACLQAIRNSRQRTYLIYRLQAGSYTPTKPGQAAPPYLLE